MDLGIHSSHNHSDVGADPDGRSGDQVARVDENMIELSAPQIEYLASQRLGRIATTGSDNKPHVVPTSFRYNPELRTIDIGGHHVATTKKYRDVQANPAAAIVVDDLVSTDPWTPRMLEIRGRAEAVPLSVPGRGVWPRNRFIRVRDTRHKRDLW